MRKKKQLETFCHFKKINDALTHLKITKEILENKLKAPYDWLFVHDISKSSTFPINCKHSICKFKDPGGGFLMKSSRT